MLLLTMARGSISAAVNRLGAGKPALCWTADTRSCSSLNGGRASSSAVRRGLPPGSSGCSACTVASHSAGGSAMLLHVCWKDRGGWAALRNRSSQLPAAAAVRGLAARDAVTCGVWCNCVDWAATREGEGEWQRSAAWQSTAATWAAPVCACLGPARRHRGPIQSDSAPAERLKACSPALPPARVPAAAAGLPAATSAWRSALAPRREPR